MRYRKVLLLICCALFIAGCRGTEGVKKDEDEYGFLVAESGEVSIPLTPFDSLDPLTTSNMSYFYLCGLVYDGLYSLDKNYKPVRELVESEEIEGHSVILKLKDAVTFHDGSTLNAGDVINSLDHIKNAGTGAYFDLIRNPINGEMSLKATALDSKTVKFTWDGPGPMLLEYLIFPIVKYKGDNDSMPLGTGPFKFEKYETKKAVYLSRYEYYYDEMPSITKVTGIVHEDEDLIFTSLETGRINVSTAWTSEYGRFYNNDKFSADIFPGNKLTFMFLNTNGPFEDENLRKGVSYAIDKDELIKNSVKDRGVKTSSFLNPKSYFSNSMNDETNLEKAAQIFSETKPTFRLYFYWGDKEQIEVANYITAALKNAGAEVNIIDGEGEDFETYLQKVKDGNYDILISQMNADIVPTYPIFLNSGIFPNEDEEFDHIISKIKNSTNSRDLLQINKELERYVINKKVFVPLFFNQNAMIYSNQIISEYESNNIFPYKSLKRAYFTEKHDGKGIDEPEVKTDEKKETKTE